MSDQHVVRVRESYLRELLESNEVLTKKVQEKASELDRLYASINKIIDGYENLLQMIKRSKEL